MNVTLVRHGIPLFQGEAVMPMSPALARRLTEVFAAELSALLMARDVGKLECASSSRMTSRRLPSNSLVVVQTRRVER